MRFLVISFLVTIGACSVFAGSTTQAAVFVDQTFDNADWTLVVFGGSQTATQVTDGGNSGTTPDPYREVTTVGSPIVYAAHLSAFSYDPTASASIDSLDFSIDYKNISYFGQGQSLQFLAKQGANYYSAGYTTTGGDYNWHTHAKTSLAAGDFNPLNLSGSSGALDLGPTGAPITFGFVTDNSGGNGIIVAYDNFSVVVNETPEPTTLLIWSTLGLIGVAWGCRR